MVQNTVGIAAVKLFYENSNFNCLLVECLIISVLSSLNSDKIVVLFCH